MINTEYGVLTRDLARQKSKHEQRLRIVPIIVNAQPATKNSRTTLEWACALHDEFIV